MLSVGHAPPPVVGPLPKQSSISSSSLLPSAGAFPFKPKKKLSSDFSRNRISGITNVAKTSAQRITRLFQQARPFPETGLLRFVGGESQPGTAFSPHSGRLRSLGLWPVIAGRIDDGNHWERLSQRDGMSAASNPRSRSRNLSRSRRVIDPSLQDADAPLRPEFFR